MNNIKQKNKANYSKKRLLELNQTIFDFTKK